MIETVHVFVIQAPEKESGPLTGVVICVGKKLTKMQSDLNAVAASLGADFRQDIGVYSKNIQVSYANEKHSHVINHIRLGLGGCVMSQ